MIPVEPLPISRREIIARAEGFFEKYREVVGDQQLLLGHNFDAVYEELIYPEYEIELSEDHDLGHDDAGKKILGEYDPVRNVAFIDRELANDPRRTFTLWHEVAGHGVLQGDWLRRQIKTSVKTSERTIDFDAENELEFQANLFAGNVAAPSKLVEHFACSRLETRRPVRYIGPAIYMLGPTNWRVEANSYNDLCRTVAGFIAPFFGGLSKEALSYRIATCGIVKDCTRSFRLRRVA